ncbi:MAG: hypothetical protein WAO10_11130 [Candidatus Sulfotelmatobacter sp.]
MRHVAEVLFATMMFAFAILGIVRPDVVLRSVKQAHPEFAGDDAPLLLIVRLIGVGGFGVVVFFSVLIIRSF